MHPTINRDGERVLRVNWYPAQLVTDGPPRLFLADVRTPWNSRAPRVWRYFTRRAEAIAFLEQVAGSQEGSSNFLPSDVART